MAIDIPVARSRLRLVKDQRKYTLMKYSNENMTEYLGVRSSHGQVKLYNKALERGLESDLTRLEITVDYERCSWGEFKRLFPVVLDNGSQLLLYYGKDIKPEMWADFHEIDAEIPEEWTKKKTKMFDEIQSYGQYQI